MRWVKEVAPSQYYLDRMGVTVEEWKVGYSSLHELMSLDKQFGEEIIKAYNKFLNLDSDSE